MTIVTPVGVMSSVVVVCSIVVMSSIVVVSLIVTIVSTKVCESVQEIVVTNGHGIGLAASSLGYEFVVVATIARGISLTTSPLRDERRTPCRHSSNTQRQRSTSRLGGNDHPDHARDEKDDAGDPQPSHVVP
jgi:hypothetical protein